MGLIEASDVLETIETTFSFNSCCAFTAVQVTQHCTHLRGAPDNVIPQLLDVLTATHPDPVISCFSTPAYIEVPLCLAAPRPPHPGIGDVLTLLTPRLGSLGGRECAAGNIPVFLVQ